jgi:hypothetical protein
MQNPVEHARYRRQEETLDEDDSVDESLKVQE